METKASERIIKCSCGKLLASEKDGHIFIKCRGCKQIVDITDIVEKMNRKKVLKKY